MTTSRRSLSDISKRYPGVVAKRLMDALALLIAATLSAGTTLALAGLDLLINERAGIIDLGAEGMMLVAAVAGFATAADSGSACLGFLPGAGASGLLAALFGVLVIWLNTSQYASGLALSLPRAVQAAPVGLRRDRPGHRLVLVSAAYACGFGAARGG